MSTPELVDKKKPTAKTTANKTIVLPKTSLSGSGGATLITDTDAISSLVSSGAKILYLPNTQSGQSLTNAAASVLDQQTIDQIVDENCQMAEQITPSEETTENNEMISIDSMKIEGLDNEPMERIFPMEDTSNSDSVSMDGFIKHEDSQHLPTIVSSESLMTSSTNMDTSGSAAVTQADSMSSQNQLINVSQSNLATTDVCASATDVVKVEGADDGELQNASAAPITTAETKQESDDLFPVSEHNDLLPAAAAGVVDSSTQEQTTATPPVTTPVTELLQPGEEEMITATEGQLIMHDGKIMQIQGGELVAVQIAGEDDSSLKLPSFTTDTAAALSESSNQATTSQNSTAADTTNVTESQITLMDTGSYSTENNTDSSQVFLQGGTGTGGEESGEGMMLGTTGQVYQTDDGSILIQNADGTFQLHSAGTDALQTAQSLDLESAM